MAKTNVSDVNYLDIGPVNAQIKHLFRGKKTKKSSVRQVLADRIITIIAKERLLVPVHKIKPKQILHAISAIIRGTTLEIVQGQVV